MIRLILIYCTAFLITGFTLQYFGSYPVTHPTCSLLCSYNGCTHSQQFPHLYKVLVASQISYLKALPGSYALVNCLLYIGLVPLWFAFYVTVVWTKPLRGWKLWITIVPFVYGVPITLLWLHDLVNAPYFLKEQYDGGVQLCLYIGKQLNLSLVESYLLIFGIGFPLLVLLTAVHLLFRLVWRARLKSVLSPDPQ